MSDRSPLKVLLGAVVMVPIGAVFGGLLAILPAALVADFFSVTDPATGFDYPWSGALGLVKLGAAAGAIYFPVALLMGHWPKDESRGNES